MNRLHSDNPETTLTTRRQDEIPGNQTLPAQTTRLPPLPPPPPPPALNINPSYIFKVGHLAILKRTQNNSSPKFCPIIDKLFLR